MLISHEKMKYIQRVIHIYVGFSLARVHFFLLLFFYFLIRTQIFVNLRDERTSTLERRVRANNKIVIVFARDRQSDEFYDRTLNSRILPLLVKSLYRLLESLCDFELIYREEDI